MNGQSLWATASTLTGITGQQRIQHTIRLHEAASAVSHSLHKLLYTIGEYLRNVPVPPEPAAAKCS
jgi:hypothetical protein